MKKHILLLCMVLISSNSFCQQFSRINYKYYNVKDLPVYFVIPEIVENSVIEEMPNLVANYWTYKNYKVLTREEAEPLEKENVVWAEFQRCQYTSRGVSYGSTANRFIMEYKGETLLTVLVENGIGKEDVVYALKQAQFIINNQSKFKKDFVWKECAKMYGDMLSKKTLLLSKNDFDEKNIAEIKAIYPYAIEIVSEAEKTKIILSGDEKYLTINYANYLWTDGKTSSFKILYSISDGTIVSYSMAKFSLGGFSSGHLLKIKDFKNFMDACKS